MKSRRRKYSDLFQLPRKYTFAVGFTCTKVSHENFVQGNAPCLSLTEKRKRHHSKWCWLKQKGFPGASSWNNCVKSSKEVLLYCCSFLRKIPNKLKDSCQYLYKKTCCCMVLRRLEYLCIHSCPHVQNSWETLLQLDKKDMLRVWCTLSHANIYNIDLLLLVFDLHFFQLESMEGTAAGTVYCVGSMPLCSAAEEFSWLQWQVWAH